MKVSKQEFSEMTKKASIPTKSYFTIPMAFLIGGLICTIGQGLIFLYQYLGLDSEKASSLASITLVLCSALATGFGVYDKLAKHAGAGTLVPITGFANAVVSPALEFKSEGLILGTGAKIFLIAGPVIVYGVSASAIYGVIYFLINM